jgi:DNA-binding transcriptional ArsR family regulator
MDQDSGKAGLSPELMPLVAEYFRALSEPARLHLLNLLRGGEYSVGQLAQSTGSSLANTSRHLSTLARLGLVEREGRGTSAYYRIADPAVFALCELVCGSLAERFRQLDAQRARLAGPAKRPGP